VVDHCKRCGSGRRAEEWLVGFVANIALVPMMVVLPPTEVLSHAESEEEGGGLGHLGLHMGRVNPINPLDPNQSNDKFPVWIGLTGLLDGF
jgi:hypothetical protein